MAHRTGTTRTTIAIITTIATAAMVISLLEAQCWGDTPSNLVNDL
jgi:hypothetical protein